MVRVALLVTLWCGSAVAGRYHDPGTGLIIEVDDEYARSRGLRPYTDEDAYRDIEKRAAETRKRDDETEWLRTWVSAGALAAAIALLVWWQLRRR